MGLLNKYPELNRGYDTQVDITAPSRWYYDTYRFSNKKPSEDYTSLLLPWNRAWFDFPIPKDIEPDRMCTYAGFDVGMVEAPDHPVSFFDGVYVDEESYNTIIEKEGGGYIINATLYLEIEFNDVLPILETFIWVRDTGEMQSSKNIIRFNEDFRTDKIFTAAMTELFTWLINPVLFSICLLNCKNVNLADRKITRQARRAAKRRGEELIVYKVLDVAPLRERIKVEGHNEKTDIHRALHICRGHFVTYTEERPMFGKYSGTFWKPMHLRGSKKYGEVRKSYKVSV